MAGGDSLSAPLQRAALERTMTCTIMVQLNLLLLVLLYGNAAAAYARLHLRPIQYSAAYYLLCVKARRRTIMSQWLFTFCYLVCLGREEWPKGGQWRRMVDLSSIQDISSIYLSIQDEDTKQLHIMYIYIALCSSPSSRKERRKKAENLCS